MGDLISYNRFLDKMIEKKYGKLDRKTLNRLKANFSMIPMDQLMEEYWQPDEGNGIDKEEGPKNPEGLK